jgi:outer membrane lipoprotein SlyB
MYNLDLTNQSGDNIINVHCPSCGYKFSHQIKNDGKITGGVGGIAGGAMLGAKIGIAMGPLGAIAGTVPGAILGGIFGKDLGGKFDNPRCPSCGIKFVIPSSLK